MAEGILGQIAASKRLVLAKRFAGVALDSLRSAATPARRSLAEALARPGARFICEIKKASPSAGAIRAGADAEQIARGYAGVADALSVLTDSEYFGGSTGDLRSARKAFDGPILAKDFFLDLRQVAEARIAGADAILVMLSLLDDVQAQAMMAEARRFEMDCLVEVHDEKEMRRALRLGARLIGINNRDLRNLSIDLATTERLAPLAPGCTLVSESGIADRADVRRLAGTVDAFLVGSALMKSDDPAQAARTLAFGRVKLCGLNSANDLEAGAAACFAGFIFVPGSARHVTAESAGPIARAARRRGILPVGVFRNAPVSTVSDVAALLDLHAVQLHGREDSDYVSSLRRGLPKDCEVWTASSVGRDPLSPRGGDRMLFDNGDGGSGESFDWRLVRDLPELRAGIVAGGIGPSNARAAAMLGAHAIDVGSALDEYPGRKCPARTRALFEALRNPCRTEARLCA